MSKSRLIKASGIATAGLSLALVTSVGVAGEVNTSPEQLRTNIAKAAIYNAPHNRNSGYKWGANSPRSVNKTAPETAVRSVTTAGFKWPGNVVGDPSNLNRPDREEGLAATEAGYKWGIRSAADQAGYKWGIRSTTDQAGYKWGIRSAADQAGYKWGIRSTTDQAGYKWGIRSGSDQAGYKWGIRSGADQSGYKWGIR